MKLSLRKRQFFSCLLVISLLLSTSLYKPKQADAAFPAAAIPLGLAGCLGVALVGAGVTVANGHSLNYAIDQMWSSFDANSKSLIESCYDTVNQTLQLTSLGWELVKGYASTNFNVGLNTITTTADSKGYVNDIPLSSIQALNNTTSNEIANIQHYEKIYFANGQYLAPRVWNDGANYWFYRISLYNSDDTIAATYGSTNINYNNAQPIIYGLYMVATSATAYRCYLDMGNLAGYTEPSSNQYNNNTLQGYSTSLIYSYTGQAILGSPTYGDYRPFPQTTEPNGTPNLGQKIGVPTAALLTGAIVWNLLQDILKDKTVDDVLNMDTTLTQTGSSGSVTDMVPTNNILTNILAKLQSILDTIIVFPQSIYGLFQDSLDGIVSSIVALPIAINSAIASLFIPTQGILIASYSLVHDALIDKFPFNMLPNLEAFIFPLTAPVTYPQIGMYMQGDYYILFDFGGDNQPFTDKFRYFLTMVLWMSFIIGLLKIRTRTAVEGGR